MFLKTTATQKILQLNKRIRVISGGTSSSKTISILLLLIQYAQQNDNQIISVVSESMPHLRKGAMRDFLNILNQHGFFDDKSWEKTNSVYSFPNGSIIEFFGVESWEKVKGARRDVLFINEANHISYEAFTQLEVRTKKFIYIDYNPESEFWFYSEIKDKRDDYDFIILTYLDNEGCPPEIVKAIEARKGNKNWWQVYGLGQLGELEGKIYKDWQIIDEIPHEARLERYGLDFGYSNDPTAIVAVYSLNGGYILDEITYQRGLHNNQIADILKNIDPALVIADSAEPKSIDELKQYGINILPSEKGPGSVNRGIDYVQSQRISITKHSLNLIKEYRNYLWKTDKEGKIIKTPDIGFEHSLDAARYALETLKEKKKHAPIIGYIGGDPVTGFGRRPIRKRGRGIDHLE